MNIQEICAPLGPEYLWDLQINIQVIPAPNFLDICKYTGGLFVRGTRYPWDLRLMGMFTNIQMIYAL